MASSKTYLVPVDFSRRSEIALRYARRLAEADRGRLLLLHVITDPAQFVPIHVRAQYYRELQETARDRLEKLARRRQLDGGATRVVVLRGGNPGRLISEQARKSRAAMIVMGSHGRTGLKRFILGSVAEKTLRYAKCPILIVKR